MNLAVLRYFKDIEKQIILLWKCATKLFRIGFLLNCYVMYSFEFMQWHKSSKFHSELLEQQERLAFVCVTTSSMQTKSFLNVSTNIQTVS